MTMTKKAPATAPALNSDRRRGTPKPAAPAAATEVRQSKTALLRQLLSAPGGATSEALGEATGWQSHTVRAAVTAVRKSGLTVETRREGGVTVYSIAAGTAEG